MPRHDGTVGFIGYGRFGRALGERMREAGLSVRAHDPRTPPPEGIAAPSPAAAAAGAGFVVLAVPLRCMREALVELRPSLGPNQLVIDVGSVKSGPAALLQEVCGRAVPWAATHPLFGPHSLALDERPLRVVVCPNRMHADAAARAAALYRRVGCEIIEQDPETHDRLMAESHALAYFVAKGFLDAGVDLDRPSMPPSVRAIARAVGSVREDAGHLFASLHRENPYAGDARRKLLDTLVEVDEALRAPVPAGEEAHDEGVDLSIQGPEEVPPPLGEARDVIDEIDRELIDLLARRASISLRAARAKADIGHAVRDPRREERLLGERRAQAERLGLDPDDVDAIFRSILRFSRLLQTRHQDGPGTEDRPDTEDRPSTEDRP